ncbi:TrkH family potassium uptake protein [Testudinibacter aquarius]|nr:TrkH family potassium uptake protein [Testudinibacter aquarius]TNG96788.1 potassium transporter [Pasteurellaceae bacterium UScroc12]TNG97276.1 potassium transporter [Pasteurellaceae bacterium USgator41]TNH00966.1 potassium transporter [Pasteurellaceae bacterium UScroc31]TNH02871.1 potassium transporter [Pasteurellaceae bacterium USgator11]KAE9531038.1 potassium transporter [Testudinibacter aquarius]
MHIQSIIRIVGILVMCFSLTMLAPALIALLYADGGGSAFVKTFFITLASGALLWWSTHTHKQELRSREGFLIVVLFWVVLGSVGALPFLLFDSPQLNVANAFFESFSGLTTTGATVIVGLDSLPKAILFYRQMLQWLGGMGIIVLAVAIIPLLGIGGMQLYRAEMPGPLKEQKMRPRIAETAKALWVIYSTLTLLCAVAYWLAGMNLFDALSHSFSTISIGGFSTHDASLGYFNSTTINLIAAVFLFISGCNFALHFSAYFELGKSNIFKLYFTDPEFKAFLFIQLSLVVICTVSLVSYSHFTDSKEALEHALLQSVSISTTAGFTTSSFDSWPSFLPMLLLMTSFIGGCAGSTGGGLKVIRVLLLFVQGKREMNRLVHPNIVQPIKLGDRVLSERIIQGIWAFFSAYLLIFILCLLAVIACGVESFDAFNAVVACLNNLGPGLGSISSNFVTIPDGAKWILTFAMICGRLEVFTLLVLFTPVFWKS